MRTAPFDVYIIHFNSITSSELRQSYWPMQIIRMYARHQQRRIKLNSMVLFRVINLFFIYLNANYCVGINLVEEYPLKLFAIKLEL